MIRRMFLHTLQARKSLLPVLIAFTVTTALAQTTTQNVSISVGNGTLSYQYEVQQGSCGSATQTSANMWQGFTYTPSGGTAISLSGNINYIYPCGYYNINGGWDYINNNSSSDDWSNELSLSPTVSINGQNCTINFTASQGSSQGYASTACTTPVTGYINPKYVILGVTYAPPGPSSYVDYTKSTLVSDTTSLNSSFLSGYSIGTKVSGGIKGWSKGSITASQTTSYSQTSNNSSSVTISKTTASSNQTPGPTNPYIGIDHDYDVIWLWLNPVDNFTVNVDGSGGVTGVTWNGYGYSTLDPAGVDVYPVYIGQLNGDLPIPSDEAGVLARTWAAGEIWPSGQGPGLTSTDFQTIEQADPYWDCTPNPSQCPVYPDSTRFTQVNNDTNLVYQQAPVGGSPQTQTYTYTYANASTSGSGTTNVHKQIFGIEVAFSGSLFLAKFTKTLSYQQTLQWTNQKNTSITNTNSSTAKVSITGPPCVPAGNSCNPIYTGPTEYDIYEDNKYGTFFFNPIN